MNNKSIGLEVTGLINSKPTGIGIYIINLIRNEIDDHIYWYLTILTSLIDKALVIAVGQITALTKPKMTCQDM